MFIFSLVRFFLDRVLLGFRTHVVATTVCTTGGVHTHSPVARTFFCCTVCLRTSAHLHACHTHAWLKARVSVKKGVCVCVLDLSISLSPSHDSPVFLAVLARSLRDQSRLRPHCWLRHPHDLAVLSHPESAGDVPFRTCIAMFGYLTRSDANTGYEPKEFDMITSVDNDTMLINDPIHHFSDFPNTTNENTKQFGVPTVFESSFSQRSHDDFALQVDSKESVQSGNRCWTEKLEEREGFVISAAESTSKERLTEQYWESFSSDSPKILPWRATENTVLKTHRKFYSDGWDLREHLQRRAQQAILGENSDQRR